MCTARSRKAAPPAPPAPPMPRGSRSCRGRSRWPSRKERYTSSPCRGGRCAISTPRPACGAGYDAPEDAGGPRGDAGRRDVRPGPGLRDPARRRALRARDRAELQQRHRRESPLRVGRSPELRRHPRGSHLPEGAPQQRRGDGRISGARRHPGNRRRAGVPRHLPGQAPRPVCPAPAVGRAGVARSDCVDVDLRFHVQRDQLDAQGRRPAARLVVLAGGTRPRARGHHHRPGVAHPAVRHRDRARRSVFDPAGDRRGGHRGWRRLLAAAVPGRVAAAPARRHGRGAVRRGLHRDRPGCRVHPHGRRAGQHDARPPHAGVPARNPGRRSRTGSGDRGLPASLPNRGRGGDAAVGPPRGGGCAMNRREVRRALKRTGLYAAALGFMLFAGFPFYWMLITAFKQNRDLYVGASDLSHVPWIFNDPPTLEHVRLLFGQTDFPRWVLNTLVVVVAVVAITVAVAVPAGYSLARLAGRWGERMGMGIFFTYLIPPTLLFVPFSRLISLLGLQNSLGSLILIYPTMTIPFCTWLVMGLLRSVPWEIEEQAMIDGYIRLALILKLAPRLIVPGILTVVVFTFTLVMQEFVYALTFISSVEKMTVSLGVPIALVRGDVYHWGALMAAALFTSIPLAVVYNLFIDRFIQGFTMGAVKG